MLVYEHDRTERIIDRLRRAESLVRVVTIVTAVVAFGFGGGYLAGPSSPLAGALPAAALGFILSSALVTLLSAAIEWMCQHLIALGAVVETRKRER